jgi:hypothetical protein
MLTINANLIIPASEHKKFLLKTIRAVCVFLGGWATTGGLSTEMLAWIVVEFIHGK